MKRMQEYASEDEATRRQLAEERHAQAVEEFSDLDAEDAAAEKASDANWQDGLDIDRHGKVKDTLGNLALILRNDPRLKDIAYNIHRSGIDIRRDAEGRTTLPWAQLKPGWNESDLGSIQIYLERVYGLYTPSKLKGILLAIAADAATIPSATTSKRCLNGMACPTWRRCSSTIWAVPTCCTFKPSRAR